MPPWAAVPGYGRFVNENTLTLREMQFLVAWVEGNGPRNAGTVFQNVVDSGLLRPKVVRAETSFDQWRLRTPSLVRPLPARTIEPKPSTVTRTVVDLGLTSTLRVRALEYMPGDRRSVRAAFFTLQETGQWLGSWTPWYGFVSLPEGSAYRLPAGAHVVAEVHYTGATGQVNDLVVDQGTLGLFFADAPCFTPSDLVLVARGDVPAGASSRTFRAQTLLPADTYALAVRPEILPGVKSIEVAVRKPDGGTEILLFAEGLSVEWPTPYIFTTPVRLPRGSVLPVTAHYANATGVAQPGGVRLTVSKYAARRT